MHIQLLVISAVFACAEALQHSGASHAKSSAVDCYSGKKLYFLHVMKDGGTSIDTFFNCLREVYNFRVMQREGPTERIWGEESCPVGFCQSHHPLFKKEEVCGSEFSDSAGFTVLREPLSRAFSLYKYYKYNQKISNLVDDDVSFYELLNRTYKCTHGTASSGDEPFCFAWNNELTSYYFAPNLMTTLLAYGQHAESMLQIGQRASGADLGTAKRLLQGLDAIFLTENFGTWISSFGRSGLPFSERRTNANSNTC
jgi:hypothetical protein